MVGRIAALVCCLLCAFPFFVIGVYDKDSSEPIDFWSGDTSLKAKVKLAETDIVTATIEYITQQQSA